MEKANLCKCNNCDTILIDQNPQVGAKEYEITGVEEEMQYTIDENGEFFWACPICETDQYLTDFPDLPNILSNKLAQATREICEKLYEEGGANKVYDYANKINLRYSQCGPCDTHTPTISSICFEALNDDKPSFYHTCAICGQIKQK